MQIARERGYLGADICAAAASDFDLEVRLGAGAYICGEETSMLESLEGRRGEVRVRPPLPAIKGLFGQPTVVNNVVSLATVPVMLARGAQFYQDFGVGKSRGTIPLQLAGNVRHGGLVERAFGLTVNELVYDYGGGSASGPPGARGADRRSARRLSSGVRIRHAAGLRGTGGEDALLGHGGVVVFDDRVDMARMARYALEFCAVESCGKCTPCRIGSTRGVGAGGPHHRRSCRRRVTAPRTRTSRCSNELCDTMFNGSLCGLGGMTPFPVRSALKHFQKISARRRR